VHLGPQFLVSQRRQQLNVLLDDSHPLLQVWSFREAFGLTNPEQSTLIENTQISRMGYADIPEKKTLTRRSARARGVLAAAGCHERSAQPEK
jgi:hypothetical protein